ncbi:TetR/AcrR family transcriptional regulator [Gordonia desulfuricans]|uniref:TetR/AcrR family transcriptional regulator n=1 Tax=Gordonia desulfuricans TaxID=89051 RepID=A0A7K3LRS9_9ACTN|nr:MULTISPECIES: TetR/AcrR family transcriptional regulator [Gordonia]EMP13181.1 TetR family transcriptional regulator [Gordonia sp. NB41Y]NDK90257.1 TetR/AcrR family transcriptional regulator [Gordonia desulfuricans]WLP91699.1 TetR/AcrR family transcriptional regulator [Gordonia sp. NB41Y]
MSTTSRRRTRSPRGSGELLAEEIIDAATELLLDEQDSSAVSIRAVATRVGVTPPSIYLHFADKEELLDAVCARYFEQLDDRMAQACAGVDDPMERALQQGLAYVRFAVSTPVLYRQAFSRTTVDTRTKVDMVLAASAFVRFTDTVTELADDGLFDPDEIADVVLELWAAAHGVASLMIAKPVLDWGDEEQRATTLLRAACLGRVVMRTVDCADPDAVRRLVDRLGTD